MFFHATLPNAICAINVGLLCKHQQVRLPLNAELQQFLVCLQRVQIIESFIVTELTAAKRQVCIILSYADGQPLVKKFTVITTPAKPVYIAVSVLQHPTFLQRGVCYILSTSRGFLTAIEAVRYHVGGKLVAVAFF